MNEREVIISHGDWASSLADAIENASRGTVIVVHSEAQKELGQGAAARMGKTVEIVVREDDCRDLFNRS